jgi:diguanylate cyclase (GGDEF)-like protein/PAS domain S-box-containing protein
MMLALPTGFATPIFPAAGIALAAAVVLKKRAMPGVALGALLVTLLGALANGRTGLPAAALALLIATAAVLQAWLGSRLLVALVKPGIDSAQESMRFLLLSPLICLISASIAVPGMVLLGVLPMTEFVVNWLTWWIGDSIGVLIGAPLCWIFIGHPHGLWRKRRILLGLPLCLASLALIVCYFKTIEWEQQRHTERFRLKSQQVADAFQAQFGEHERLLLAMAAIFNDSARMQNPAEFHKMARVYLDNRPELRRMVWAPHVLAQDRARFERWARDNIGADFAIRQIGSNARFDGVRNQTEHYPLTMIEPVRGNEPALGLDLLSEPVRAETVARTLASKRPAASEPLMLKLEKSDKRGILLLQTVTQEGNGARQTPVGIISLVLEVSTYLDRTLASSDFSGFLVRLEDVTLPGRPLQVLDNLQRAAVADDFQAMLSLGGRQYRLTLAQTEHSKSKTRGWQSWAVLVFGLVLSALLGALLLTVSGERERIGILVRERTQRLHEREARLQAILDHAADAILTIAPNGRLVSSNAAASALFGHDVASMQTLMLEQLLQIDADESASALLQRLSGERSSHAKAEIELMGRTKAQHLFPLLLAVSKVDLSEEHFYVCILHDLSEQRQSQKQIYELAHHDPLTGLANRFMLNLRLEQLLALCQREQTDMAVMFIDLDHFKKINDTHGHQVGDQLLVEVARRLRDMVRDADTIARQGGDEFIVVLGGNAKPDTISAVAKRILLLLAQPYHIGKLILHTGASIGVSMFPTDSSDADTLLLHADTAMYAAKGQGRGNFQFFSEAMNAVIRERLLLESRLWQALEQHEFELYLQPQILLDGNRLVGAEALLRWHHPELGLVLPNRFIPIAEESGLMLPLGEWVLARGIAMLASWQARGLPPLRLALNLSARQCHDDNLLPSIDRLLLEHGISAAMLELEITESAAMQDPEQTAALLRQLRQRGINVAIDDFGTGYSSLSYLKVFAIDRIKIDRSFVKDIETDPNDAVIVNTTITLAHSLGLEVIAEGVETPAQANFLRSHGCDEAQGYLFAKPLPLAQFEQFVQTHMAQPYQD